MHRVHLAAGIARYVWAAPCTAVGLCLVAPAFCSVPPPGWLTVLLKSHFPRSNRPTFSLERYPLTRSRSVTSYSQAAKQNSTACEHMSRPTSGNTKGGEYSSSWHTPLRAFGSC